MQETFLSHFSPLILANKDARALVHSESVVYLNKVHIMVFKVPMYSRSCHRSSLLLCDVVAHWQAGHLPPAALTSLPTRLTACCPHSLLCPPACPLAAQSAGL